MSDVDETKLEVLMLQMVAHMDDAYCVNFLGVGGGKAGVHSPLVPVSRQERMTPNQTRHPF